MNVIERLFSVQRDSSGSDRDDLKGGYELAELVVLSEPHTQLQGSAPLLQNEAAAREHCFVFLPSC